MHYVGQPVALVVADDAAPGAAGPGRPSRLEIEELPPVLDPRQAAAQGPLIAPPRTFALGDVDQAWPACACVVAGRVDSGGQEHLYLETQAAVAVPGEKDTLRVISATQSPGVVQRIIARVLGLPMSRVAVEVFRLGGAFGGKEDQATAWAVLAALAARAAAPAGQAGAGAAARTCAAPASAIPIPPTSGSASTRRQDPGLRGDLLPERRRRRRPVDRHPRAHAVPRHQQLPHPQRPRHRHLLPHQPAALHRLPRLRRAAGDVRHGGGHLPGRREAWASTPAALQQQQPARRRRRVSLRPEGRRTAAPDAASTRRQRASTWPAARAARARATTPHNRLEQERAGADAGLLRHLVHHHHPEPGRRPGPRLHRRQRVASRPAPSRWARG
ncbi:MAG: molybdopterin-dependent oxidoreductase [Rhodopseudomonas palustris]|nr:molybdopterin-dependent oxidoreductase [Rhodopseudomonas palustris]